MSDQPKTLPPEMAKRARDLIAWSAGQPGLISLLYDLGLLPEQLEECSEDWFDMVIIIAHWPVGLEEVERYREAFHHIALLADSLPGMTGGASGNIKAEILAKARNALASHNPPPNAQSPVSVNPRPLGEPASGGAKP